MNKEILKEFLKAGYLEDFKYHKTDMGVPQGGVISPIIANIVLTGLEKTVKEAVYLGQWPRYSAKQQKR